MTRQSSALERVLCLCVGMSTCPRGVLGLARPGGPSGSWVLSCESGSEPFSANHIPPAPSLRLQLLGPSGHFTSFGARRDALPHLCPTLTPPPLLLQLLDSFTFWILRMPWETWWGQGAEGRCEPRRRVNGRVALSTSCSFSPSRSLEPANQVQDLMPQR